MREEICRFTLGSVALLAGGQPVGKPIGFRGPVDGDVVTIPAALVAAAEFIAVVGPGRAAAAGFAGRTIVAPPAAPATATSSAPATAALAPIAVAFTPVAVALTAWFPAAFTADFPAAFTAAFTAFVAPCTTVLAAVPTCRVATIAVFTPAVEPRLRHGPGLAVVLPAGGSLADGRRRRSRRRRRG